MKSNTSKSSEKTYLERGLSPEWLYKIAVMEANRRKPIYQIHKWWARRLGSVFRALTIASFSDSNDTAWKLRSKYYNGHSLSGKVILDPFMGGGTTLVEALKLGCKVVGVDVNPVAWFVTKKELEPFDEKKATEIFQELDKSVGKRIRKLYVTKCNKGHSANILYALWIQKIECSGCKKIVPLFRDYIVLDQHGIKQIICPTCHSIFRTKSNASSIKCKECGTRFNPYSGVVVDGNFKCPHCSWSTPIREAAQKLGNPLPAELFAIEYLCDECGRGFKKPSTDDFELYSEASEQFHKLKNELMIPDIQIPVKDRVSQRPVNHGYNYFHELFNERQLLCLGLLLKEIAAIKDQSLREFFLLAFSSSLETNNRLCKYESKWGKISALFGIPGYHVVQRYAENNVWGTGEGRGTFEKHFLKLIRGKKYASDTYESIFKKNNVIPKHIGESASSNLAEDFSQLLDTDTNVLLSCQSSENLSFLPSKSIDAVITDPPYFDNIQYCELADFFYVWLRLLLKKDYDHFKPNYSSRQEEIVAKNSSSGELDNFSIKLSNVFSECHRVLNDDGLLVFTFHHTNTKVWLALRNALSQSHFIVTSVPIVRAEGRTGYRKDGNTSIDACVVCRKISNEMDDNIKVSTKTILKNCTSISIKLKKVDGSIKKSDIFTILMSQSLLYTPEIVKKISTSSEDYVDILANKVLEKDS